MILRDVPLPKPEKCHFELICNDELIGLMPF
jgi:hypothetical protein